jgi:hypothetical protein
VEKFQTDAHKLLEEEDPEASDIEACVDFGLSLEIELTELAQLKEKQKQVKLAIKGTTFSLDIWGRIHGAHDIQHNYFQHNDSQHNDPQQNDSKNTELICDTQHK